jgi:hypothetical protein
MILYGGLNLIHRREQAVRFPSDVFAELLTTLYGKDFFLDFLFLPENVGELVETYGGRG